LPGAWYNLQAQTDVAYQSFQWQKQTSAGFAFEDIAGATFSEYAGDVLGAYRVIVGNGFCFDSSGAKSKRKAHCQAF
jgi:hypothetical protein